jgi:hypothetical protein
MDSYVFIHHKRDGTTTVERRYVDGRTDAAKVRRTGGNAGVDGCYMKSMSMGVPVHQLAKAKKVDVALGVNADYEVRGKMAYKTFPYKSDMLKWMKKHKWVSHDPGYSYPVPGDFVSADQQAGMPGPRRVMG